MTNLVRAASAGALGVASAVVASVKTLTPLDIGGTKVGYDAITEAAGLVIGAGLQFMSPFTMPALADGLVDGGVALVAKRGTHYIMAQTGGAALSAPSMRVGGAWAPTMMGGDGGFPALAGSSFGRRGQIGGVRGVQKVSLT